MPVSKKRKKKRRSGKPKEVIFDDPQRLSGVTLQDLIKVIAYQDSEKEKHDDA